MKFTIIKHDALKNGHFSRKMGQWAVSKRTTSITRRILCFCARKIYILDGENVKASKLEQNRQNQKGTR